LWNGQEERDGVEGQVEREDEAAGADEQGERGGVEAQVGEERQDGGEREEECQARREDAQEAAHRFLLLLVSFAARFSRFNEWVVLPDQFGRAKRLGLFKNSGCRTVDPFLACNYLRYVVVVEERR